MSTNRIFSTALLIGVTGLAPVVSRTYVAYWNAKRVHDLKRSSQESQHSKQRPTPMVQSQNLLGAAGEAQPRRILDSIAKNPASMPPRSAEFFNPEAALDRMQLTIPQAKQFRADRDRAAASLTRQKQERLTRTMPASTATMPIPPLAASVSVPESRPPGD